EKYDPNSQYKPSKATPGEPNSSSKPKREVDMNVRLNINVITSLLLRAWVKYLELSYVSYKDVITKSEKYWWMGPKGYDYAGTKVFLKHSFCGLLLDFTTVK
ncbi:hypothetical protein Tco_1398210, partial [Tanacetum coccineum]